MDKKALFNSIANKYDKINDTISLFTHRRFRQRALAEIPDKDYETIVDLCCGTGDMSEILKKRYPNSKIIGIDFSENMLNIARKRLPDVNFIENDISNLPLQSNSIDLCIISFGLRNVNNMDLVLSEIKRVLKPKGIFFNIDLGKPNKFWNIFLKPYMYIIVPILGKIACGQSIPLKYFVHSNETFPSPEELEKIYERFSLKHIMRKDFLFGQISCQICSLSKDIT